jgi:hypothetical protein
MSFNRNRKIVITVGKRKGQSHINERDIIKEIGESLVELEDDEEVLMVKLLNTVDSVISEEENLLRKI